MIKNICTVTDDSYIMGTAVMLESLYLTTPTSQGSRVFILYDKDELSDKNKSFLQKKFNGKFQLEFITSRAYEAIKQDNYEYVKKEYLDYGWNFSVVLQAFIEDAINDDSVEKVLYLDSDTIFFRSAEDILNFDLNRPIAAQIDPGVGNQVDYPIVPYFNAGVYIADLKYWRERRITSLFTIGDESIFHAQDFLNTVFYNNWQLLGPQINVTREKIGVEDFLMQTGKFELDNFIYHRKPILVHYLGQPKPWKESFIKEISSNWRACGKLIWIDDYYFQILDRINK